MSGRRSSGPGRDQPGATPPRGKDLRRAAKQAARAPDDALADGLPGLVVRAYGLWYDVQLRDDARVLLATMAGTLKREKRKTDVVAVGDHVRVRDVGEGEGRIVAVEPRTRVLARLARHTRDVEQVILANPDQALFLFAVREPAPHRRMLDRFLILAEQAGVPALIGVNKLDLDLPVPDPAGGPDTRISDAVFGDYRTIYPVHYLSAATGQGLDGLRSALEGKVTAVAGPSGVGKSSLLNALHPDGRRAIGGVSGATGKGRHTTIGTQLELFGPGTYVADTPGIRSLAMTNINPEALDGYFPEFRPYLDDCFYADCTHLHEPGCGVREALAAGRIAPARYESYAALRRGDTEDS